MRKISRTTRLRYCGAFLSILGLSALWICMYRHTCMCGHLKHGQNIILAGLVDGIWIICLPAAAITIARSTMYGRLLIAVCLVFLTISNALYITGRISWHAPHQYAVGVAIIISISGTLLGLIIGRETRSNKRVHLTRRKRRDGDP
jgi:hypothetical protein